MDDSLDLDGLDGAAPDSDEPVVSSAGVQAADAAPSPAPPVAVASPGAAPSAGVAQTLGPHSPPGQPAPTVADSTPRPRLSGPSASRKPRRLAMVIGVSIMLLLVAGASVAIWRASRNVRTAHAPDGEPALANGTVTKPAASDSEPVSEADEAARAPPRHPVTVEVRFPGWLGVNAMIGQGVTRRSIDELLAQLEACQGVLTVVGHACAIGDDMTNLRVSSARARHVRKVLIAHGIAADRIETVAKGSSEPIADNNTRAGRRQNRRVMIRCQQW